MQKLKKAFPTLPEEFYDILCERIKEHELTDKRLIKAVNYVIDNCVYPTPTIANFILYDQEEQDSIPYFLNGTER